jgi:hypothetical protein
MLSRLFGIKKVKGKRKRRENRRDSVEPLHLATQKADNP